MPVKDQKTAWSKHMTIIRDVVFIILFLASVVGWIRSEVIKKTKLESQIEILSKSMDENTKQLEKINEILLEQQELNGKIIYFLEHNDN